MIRPVSKQASIFPPVPVHIPFEHIGVHFVADEEVGLGEAFYHGVVKTGDIAGSGQFLIGSRDIVLNKGEGAGVSPMEFQFGSY